VSKADLYRDLVLDVENLVIGGESALTALMLIALTDDGVDGKILKHWVCRKHETEQGLEAWAEKKRDAAEASSSKFQELSDIIEGLSLAALNPKIIPQLTPWHRWIRNNCWNDAEVKQSALSFAQIALRRRRLQTPIELSEQTYAPNQ
jgi:hypothetical protein